MHLELRKKEEPGDSGLVGAKGNRRRGRKRIRWLDSFTDSMHMNLSKLQEIAKDRGAGHAAAYGITKSQTRLRD